MFFIVPYFINGLKKSTPIIEYHMGRFGRNDDSGVEIDWDAYDRLNNPSYEPEDRGIIEVPANAETVIYESPDGETYEISISDLIEADDDNEIEYSSKNRSFSKINSKKKHKNKLLRRNSVIGDRLKYRGILFSNQKRVVVR